MVDNLKRTILCVKRSNQLTSLAMSLPSPAEEKSHTCVQCGKSLGTAQGLMEHMRIHTGERLFNCGQCNKSFTQRGNLKTHQLTHTREKPFKCEVCEKSFGLDGSLKTHMLTHTQEKYKRKQTNHKRKCKIQPCYLF